MKKAAQRRPWRAPTNDLEEAWPMSGKLVNRFSLGFAVGYVLGARAGRERYEQIQGWWSSFVGAPAVREATQRGRDLVAEAAPVVASKIRKR
jgi:hypothetical protein